MRASTLFALAAAVLIGLGVAVAAKMSGYFNRAEVVVKRPDTLVLVANHNLFANDLIDNSGVRVRPIKDSEIEHYNKHKEQYLPAVPAAAILRVTKANITADSVITSDLLKEMVKPAPLNERLLPDTRAVNISLSKERSAGGNIQVGEWVDVYLTSQISGDGQTTTRTAAIAPSVRLIAKRDSLWPVYAPLPKDKPVEYTLEVNSYRAGMIEFSRTKGQLSMSPLPAGEQKKLEAGRNERLAASKNGEPMAMAPEEEEETRLVQAVEKKELIISDEDLVKLFGVTVEQKPTAPPPQVTTTVERYIGTKRVEAAIFTLDGSRYTGQGGLGASISGWNAADHTYPHGPYSRNVDLRDGKMIPNRDMYYGANHDSYTFGANGGRGNYGGGSSGSRPNWKFGAPPCVNCGKNKN